MPTSHYPWMKQWEDKNNGKKGMKSKGESQTEQSDLSDNGSKQINDKGKKPRRRGSSHSKGRAASDGGTNHESSKVGKDTASRRDSPRGVRMPPAHPKPSSPEYDDRDKRRKRDTQHAYSRSTSAEHDGGDMPLHSLIQLSSQQGKSQMSRLNERLVTCLQQTSVGPGDELRQFRELFDNMRKDMERMRHEADREITTYKRKIEKNTKEYADIFSKYKVAQLAKDDYEARCHEAHQKVTELESEESTLRRKIMELEASQAELKIKSKELEYKCPTSEDSRYAEVLDRYQTAERKYNEEKKRVEYLEDCLRTESQKQDTNKREWKKQIRLLTETIETLELKANKSNSSINFSEVLQEIRQTCLREMNEHHHKTEEALHHSLHQLQGEMGESRLLVEKLNSQNAGYKEQMNTMKTDISRLESEKTHFEERLTEMRKEFAMEQESHQIKVSELEGRSNQFYHQYLEKTRECTEARETQIALQTEIDSFQAILDVEEQRDHKVKNGPSKKARHGKTSDCERGKGSAKHVNKKK